MEQQWIPGHKGGPDVPLSKSCHSFSRPPAPVSTGLGSQKTLSTLLTPPHPVPEGATCAPPTIPQLV